MTPDRAVLCVLLARAGELFVAIAAVRRRQGGRVAWLRETAAREVALRVPAGDVERGEVANRHDAVVGQVRRRRYDQRDRAWVVSREGVRSRVAGELGPVVR